MSLYDRDLWEDIEERRRQVEERVGFSIEENGTVNKVFVEKVDHPAHYNKHPSGIECIDVVEHMNFCLGNVIKYVWRAGEKGAALEDLKKARWYLEREILRREKNIV